MPQVTIYLKDEILAIVRAAAKSTGISQSKWIAEAVRLRAKREWPASVVALAGAWPDFPTAEEIRGSQGTDASRKKL
ncbi:MAG: CopG family transcriptional regulator [Acidobacteriaceae bacterium]|nr:CopG family transcriptional regulator [Acidobacteriaceae bacterium]